MEDLFKNDDFAQFITNENLADLDMIDEQKREHIGSSIEEFDTALDCFKLSVCVVSKY